MTPHQFEIVLRVRKHRRDELRRFVAKVVNEGKLLNEQIGQLDSAREASVQALKQSMTTGIVDVDRAASLRRHTMQLAFERASLAQHAASHAERLKATQALLAKADMDVKAVEKLRERFDAARRREMERREDRDATDRFSSKRGHDDSSRDDFHQVASPIETD